ncbi:MAG: 2-C-methyl-D-erythritol 2,4-cyclodiphosphate synthase [Candidatus Omnitrophica bacterium]|nr:2-C-methyl-D-erythritol 2,4-cyclodiphosphate synthase [Candidatus Omnitrophota bacterium]
MTNKVGIGYDIHRLVKGRKLILGGVEVPFEKGLLGHSDADVLLHAIMDALLGAVGEGDIGELFPDTDQRYKDISSVALVRRVVKLLAKKGFRIVNLDTVIIAQKPNLTAFKSRIRASVARAFCVEEKRVNIKAKTNESMDAIGDQQAIAAHAVVMVCKGRI